MTTTLICLLNILDSPKRLDKLLTDIQDELISIWADDALQPIVYGSENNPLYVALIRDARTAPYIVLSLNDLINDSISHNPIELCKVKYKILPTLKKIKRHSHTVEIIYECVPNSSEYAVWGHLSPSMTMIETIHNIYKAC